MTGSVGLSAPTREDLARLTATRRLLVCCDFDGTLSHLAEHPMAARPVPGAVAVLDALGSLPDTWAAIVSGRALSVLAPLAAMPEHVQLVGSHGTEFERGVIASLGSRERALLDEVAARCAIIVEDVPGTLVESKPASVAVSTSALARPPSGPMSRAMLSGAMALGGLSAASGCSTSFICACTVVTQFARSCGAKIRGTRLRPHCSQALMAICCQ